MIFIVAHYPTLCRHTSISKIILTFLVTSEVHLSDNVVIYLGGMGSKTGKNSLVKKAHCLQAMWYFPVAVETMCSLCS